jgi:hypothetical protein
MLIGDEMVFTDDVDVVLELIALGHMARELVMVLGKTL